MMLVPQDDLHYITFVKKEKNQMLVQAYVINLCRHIVDNRVLVIYRQWDE